MAPPSQYPYTIELPYRWGEIEGSVRVDLRENDDPARLGCPELARGFPTCKATVEPVGNGYADLLGWDPHHDYLHRVCPGWSFAPGFHEHPLRP